MEIKKKLTKLIKVLKARGRFVPLFADILITHRCNANCVYCYASFPSSNKKDMELSQLKKIIDELKSLGCIEIALDGGEPLIRDDIDEVVDYIKEQDMKVRITTNGLLIKKRIDTLAKVDVIVISLDGNPGFNNATKNIKKSEEIIENLGLLKKLNKKLRINTTLTKQSFKQLDFIGDLCRQNNLPLKINILHDAGIKYPGGLAITNYAPFISKLKAMKKRVNIINSQRVLNKFLEWSKTNTRLYRVEKVKGRKDKYCGKNSIEIDVDGYVYPCCLYRPKIANCFEEPLLDCMKKVESRNFCNDCAHFGLDDFNNAMNLDVLTIIELIKNFRYY